MRRFLGYPIFAEALDIDLVDNLASAQTANP